MAAVFSGSKAHVNLLKGYAILAVVSIHFIHAYIGRFSVGTTGWLLLVSADQITRFCVPVFVAVSGFALARKYAALSPGFFQFFSSRAVKILPPYLAWSLVYYLVGWFIPSLAIFSRTTPVWELAVSGRVQYHLYFVPMIFQLYLLFPLIFRLLRRFGLPLVAVSLIVQFLLYLRTGAPGWSDQTQYIWFHSWIYYFILGIFLGMSDLSRFLSSKIVPVLVFALAAAGLVWTIADGFLRLDQTKDLILAASFTRPPVLLFASGTLLAGFFISGPKFVSKIGVWSYQIYLGHVLFLQLLSLL